MTHYVRCATTKKLHELPAFAEKRQASYLAPSSPGCLVWVSQPCMANNPAGRPCPTASPFPVLPWPSALRHRRAGKQRLADQVSNEHAAWRGSLETSQNVVHGRLFEIVEESFNRPHRPFAESESSIDNHVAPVLLQVSTYRDSITLRRWSCCRRISSLVASNSGWSTS